MDGLVLDTESTYCTAWQQAAATMGYTFTDNFCRSLSGLHGKDLELQLLAYCGNDFNLPAFHRQAGDCWRTYIRNHRITIKYGFHSLLEFIKGNRIPFCLATNSRRANAYECLELAGLQDTFPLVVSRDEVVCGKPEPDIFLTAAALLRTPINRCLVLEDSHVGIVAAHKAGAFSVLIPSAPTIEPVTLKLCNAIMTDLAELLKALETA